MKIASHLLLPSLLLGAPLALAAPDAAPAAQAPASKPIDVNFRGTLRDALKQIAEQGGLNVVATGNLDTAVEVHLRGITADQALKTIARTYSLRLRQDNSIYTLRPMTDAERRAAEEAEELEEATGDTAPLPVPAPPVAAVSPPALPEAPSEGPSPREIRKRIRDEMRKAQRRSRGDQDVVARGQSLEVKEGESVDNAVVYGGNMVVRGHVEKDAVVFGGNLDVFGSVDGDVHAFGGTVTLHPGARVEGEASAIGGQVVQAEGAHVEGDIESMEGTSLGSMVLGEVKDSLQKEFKRSEEADSERSEATGEDDDSGGGFPAFLLKFAALFGLGFLGQLLFPTRMKELAAEIKAQPVNSGLTGLLGAVALIPISVILAITLVGIPVLVLMWLVIPLAAALGLAAVASEIGLRLPFLRGRKTQAAVLALGLLVLLGVGAIPVLGWLVMALAVLVAFGAVIRTRFGSRTRSMPEPYSPHSTL
ncbi:hypothetical protein SAMN05444354_102207 [Stigmatella aurantiaca]|uniref:DUF8173 domain-containing protein n=1 Tax=Stigmatella aurantiaca TaxID=41 RepID=A0A1H7JH65_STIAU|nr:polymer-forming cytoskeletal protein [Stigmatella aurantiaca]SEK73782.1 hypothetical protein SAMN05444354_102207 [Stigmatella aurantiaca]